MSSGCRRTVYRPHLVSEILLAHSPSVGSRTLRSDCPPTAVATARVRLPGRSARNTATVLLCLFSAMSFPRVVAAAEWSSEPSISMASGHDDNPTLTTGPHGSVWATYLSPQINLRKATEASAVNLDFLLNGTHYSGNQVADTNSEILSLSSFVQTTERTKWGLDGELRRDTLLQSLTTTPGTGNLQDTDVGLVSQKVNRNWRSAQPSWNYELSERSSLGLSYGFTDVGFSNATGTGLVNYKNHLLSAIYSRTITGQDDLNVTINRSAYRPEETGTKSDTTQLLAGMSHAFSETARGRFSAGVSKTSEPSATGTQDTNGAVLVAGMVQRSELTTFDGVISRDVEPSGGGQSVISNQLRLYLVRKISPMLDAGVKVIMFRDKVLQGSDPTTDRRYYELIPDLSWQWRPEWAVGVEYHYRRQKFDADPVAAKENALYVGLTYTWPQQVASR